MRCSVESFLPPSKLSATSQLWRGAVWLALREWVRMGGVGAPALRALDLHRQARAHLTPDQHLFPFPASTSAARPNTLPRPKRGRGGCCRRGECCNPILGVTANTFIGARQGKGTCHFGAKPELATLLPHTVLGPREHLSTERAGDRGAYRVRANMRTRERSGGWRLCLCLSRGLACLGLRA